MGRTLSDLDKKIKPQTSPSFNTPIPLNAAQFVVPLSSLAAVLLLFEYILSKHTISQIMLKTSVKEADSATE